MGLWYSFRIALRALAVNKGRTTLTALGVIIGVGAVIAMVGLGQGFGEAIRKEINASGANWMYLMPGQQRNGPGLIKPGRIFLADLDACERLYPKTFTEFVPIVGYRGTLKYRNRSSETNISGSTSGYMRLANVSMQHGSFIGRRDVDGRMKTVVLGAKVVKDLTGSPTTDMTGKTVLLERQAFLVRGVLKEKGQFLGDNQDDTAIIPVSTMMRRLRNTDQVDFAGVQAASGVKLEQAQDRLKRTLRARHRISPPYSKNDDFTIQTQEGAMREVGMVTNILSMLLGSIAAISLFVGGIGIMNIMLVSVTERTREIGLRKAIGATTGTILGQFLIESVMVSVLGGLLGVLFGLGTLFVAATAISSNTAIKIQPGVSPQSVILAFVVSATIGITFGIYPAWRAARLDPIEALRYE
jgi:putative ABC transport system permease protein